MVSDSHLEALIFRHVKYQNFWVGIVFCVTVTRNKAEGLVFYQQ